jgi:hypothetical protein
MRMAIVLGLMAIALIGCLFSLLSPTICVVIVAIAMIIFGRGEFR